MIKEYIYFSIGFEDVNWADEDEQVKRNAFVKEFMDPFNIKCGFAGQGRVALDMLNIDLFLDKLQQYRESKNLLFSKNCAYVHDYEGESEWYKYLPSRAIGTTNYDGCVLTCKASNIPANINVGCGIFGYTFVSNKFKEVIEDSKLTGLEFLWCKDIGRFAPPKQWYMAIATEFIGRGLDAPWFDVNSEGIPQSEKYPHGFGRIGLTSRIPAKCILKDAPIPLRLKRYLSMCDIEKFNFSFNERFLKEYLPTTDFAFGYFPGWQGFYIRKNAIDILLHSHLISKADLRPVVILDKLPEAATQLDDKECIPAFNYGHKRYIGENITFEELKNIHEQARKAYENIPKLPKIITMKQALSLVNMEKRSRPEDFKKRLTDKELMKYNIKIPFNWVELLKKSNGGYLSSDCYLVSICDIEPFTMEKLKEGKSFYEKYPKNRISVAKRPDGDWYDLVIDADSDVDCNVVLVTHEGGDILREWESIATFIYEMIIEND